MVEIDYSRISEHKSKLTEPVLKHMMACRVEMTEVLRAGGGCRLWKHCSSEYCLQVSTREYRDYGLAINIC